LGFGQVDLFGTGKCNKPEYHGDNKFSIDCYQDIAKYIKSSIVVVKTYNNPTKTIPTKSTIELTYNKNNKNETISLGNMPNALNKNTSNKYITFNENNVTDLIVTINDGKYAFNNGKYTFKYKPLKTTNVIEGYSDNDTGTYLRKTYHYYYTPKSSNYGLF